MYEDRSLAESQRKVYREERREEKEKGSENERNKVKKKKKKNNNDDNEMRSIKVCIGGDARRTRNNE